jgi:hypothetical protein
MIFSLCLSTRKVSNDIPSCLPILPLPMSLRYMKDILYFCHSVLEF